MCIGNCSFAVNNKTDPTQQSSRRTRAFSNIRARLDAVMKDVVKFAEEFKPERVVVEDGLVVNRVEYKYEIDADQMELINQFILDRFKHYFETGDESRNFLETYVEDAYRSGTARTLTRVRSVVRGSDLLAKLDVERFLLSDAFQRRVGLVKARTFNEMEGFTSEAAKKVSRVLSDSMIRGKSPRSVVSEVAEAIGSSEARALRIARTEINEAYRQARFEESREIRDDLQINLMVVHRSALLATTRPEHAARHGRMYTIEDQQAWWAQNGNSINCYCVAEEVYVDENGEVFDNNLMKELQRDRKEFFKLND